MAETWRVVLADGDIESVSAWRTDDGTMVRWDREIVHTHTTNVRRGVCMAIEGHDLAIVEILAPGELTRAELLARIGFYEAQIAPMTRAIDSQPESERAAIRAVLDAHGLAAPLVGISVAAAIAHAHEAAAHEAACRDPSCPRRTRRARA